ncbi:DUF7555 family protein [Natronosalvus rutilus]|uniref:Uncharacterized protein n=1 Tax=Natronosalvus rutilus TaxID=2953753 RepID=A0A9E7N745_9EURY|nr:hypothetical protein [Natronosalvus rutilus]UTF52934.1 hypothetical protein NGM29_14280 [Natronosalvus rutilus]
MTRLESVQWRLLALVCADAISYVFAVVVVATLTAVPISLAVGGGFGGAKVVLFFAGFLLLAYATVRLWPNSPEEVSGRSTDAADAIGMSVSPTGSNETRFQRFARALPPARWIEPPPPDRELSSAGKLFWSSLGVLLISYLMETVFGVV